MLATHSIGTQSYKSLFGTGWREASDRIWVVIFRNFISKLNEEKDQNYLKIQSWLGLATGLLLFVISISESLIVFYDEIDLFFNTELLKVKQGESKASVNEIYAIIKTTFPQLQK